MRILHIDDDEAITDSFSLFLSKKNYDYTGINDGKRGVEEICSGKYEIVLLDLLMPDFTGFDVIKELQKRSKNGNNIIILTASPLEHSQQEMINKFGVDSILFKPTSINKILSEVQRISSKLVA